MPNEDKAKQLGLFSLFGLSLVWSPMFGTTEAFVFPSLAGASDALLLSRICNLAAFGVVMAALSFAGERMRASRKATVLLAAIMVLGSAGMVVGSLVGMGILPISLLAVGAAMRGFFYGMLTVFWLGGFVRLDDETIGAAVAGSLVTYAVAGLIITWASSVSPILALALLAACPIVSIFAYVGTRSLSNAHAPVDQESTQAPPRTRYLLYAANFAFGIMLGSLLHYFAFYDSVSSILAFLATAVVFFAIFSLGHDRLDASFVYRAFTMCFAIVISLALLFGMIDEQLAILSTSAGLAFLILYTIIIFTDTQARLRNPYWKVPGMTQVFASLGMISASVLFQTNFPTGDIPGTQLMLLASACFIFVAAVFTSSNRTRQRPWGFSSLIPAESNEARIIRRCGELAEECGLTVRELEVLQQLAAGMTKDQIAERLFISPTTAKTHIRNIYAKLDVHSQRELAARLE